MFFGFLTMFAVAYLAARPKAQRSDDFETIKNLIRSIFAGIKEYYQSVLNRPLPPKAAYGVAWCGPFTSYYRRMF
jgi:hypothetical protein